MNWLDAVLLMILVLSLVAGYHKGLSHQVIGSIAVVAAIVLGLWTYGLAGAYLTPYVSSRRMANFAGFALVFFGVMAVGGLVSFIIGKIVKFTGLTFVDRMLGAALGVLRGALISVAAILVLTAFSVEGKPPQLVVRSRLAPYAMSAARVFAAMAPHEMRESFRRTYSEVKVAWNRTVEKGLREGPEVEKGKDAKRD